MPVDVAEFLSAFFRPHESVCMRTFSDIKARGVRPKMYRFPLAELDKCLPEMRERNEKERCGVHFVVNLGGQYDKDIVRVNAVFCENDSLAFDDQMRIIEASPIEPSIMVKTQKSLHCYFLVEDLPVRRFRNIQERLALKFHSDMQVRNESHTMRVPSFLHMKKDPIRVQCIKFDPEIRYTRSDLEAVLPPPPPKPKKNEIRISLPESADREQILEYVRSKLTIAYEKEDKIICHCLFPEHHSRGDRTPSAVFFKEKSRFYCSGCGASYGLYELASRLGWNDLMAVLDPHRQ